MSAGVLPKPDPGPGGGQPSACRLGVPEVCDPVIRRLKQEGKRRQPFYSCLIQEQAPEVPLPVLRKNAGDKNGVGGDSR